ncbi:hypothetical protein K466DRAFT_503946 [Polyporus arcularius HHB13444]|uniref:Sodium/calcium exchanger membrane region domain-containing protein n=1 Tax=Polyporus arcularius HHB13444 TaxID=1314778 RepID=A0A5C3P3R8_9APHY|nr:hypothetical protein K466DRAFT_503946 [Polyporus arcularius HHB13444]
MSSSPDSVFAPKLHFTDGRPPGLAPASESTNSPNRTSTRGDSTNLPIPITSTRSTNRSSSSSRPSLLQQLTKPEHRVGRNPSLKEGLKAIVLSSWWNILLVFVPISWACSLALDVNDSKSRVMTFVFAFLALVPLTQLLAFATDELSIRVGHFLAELLHITLVIALSQCQIQVVQASLIGSILSNLLFVVGLCFFAGGMRFSEQGFGVRTTKLHSSLLVIFAIALLLPASFNVTAAIPAGDFRKAVILSLSRGAAVILMILYGCFLVFQLFSHKSLYNEKHDDVLATSFYDASRNSTLKKVVAKSSSVSSRGPQRRASVVHSLAASATSTGEGDGPDEAEVEEIELPMMSVPLTVVLLVIVAVIVGVTAKFLVDSIDRLTEAGHVSKEFIGLMLPLALGNIGTSAVTMSVKDKVMLSLHIAIGSSIQMALLIIPFLVTLGWAMHKPMSLLFDPFQSIVLSLSVLVVNDAVQGGTSNWMEGMVLLCLYMILTVVFWYYPGTFVCSPCTVDIIFPCCMQESPNCPED